MNENPDAALLVLSAARRHVWVVSAEDPIAGETRRLRVLGGVDLAPGDLVPGDGGAAVRLRLERSSTLRRKTSRGEQVLAANLDDLVVISAAGMVEGGEGLIARCIAAAGAEGMRVVLVFNKVDLDHDGSMRKESDGWAALGFEVHVIGALSRQGLESIESRLAGRTAALVGVSGVGKSTLINALSLGAALRTAEVNEDGRGRHTTSLGRAIPWAGGLLVDLPGVRSFGLFDEGALCVAYPEIESASDGCRFRDCSHGPEPDCGVKEAVERGEIASARLESWRRVRQSIIEGREGAGR